MGGGAERVIVILLQHLDRARFEPHLVLVSKAGPYLKELPEDVPVHDLGASRVRNAIPGLVRLLRSLKPDVVVPTFRELSSALLLLKRFLPPEARLAVRVDASVSVELAQDVLHAGFWRWVYRHHFARADKIICVSEYVCNDLAEHFGIPRAKMFVIYNPVDVERVRRLADGSENPFAGLAPHLVAVGRLVRVKGYDVLIDALALVRKTIPAQLTILGEGPLEMDLKARSERLGLAGAIEFAGFQSNPYPYLKHADLFLLSSRYEGLPLVVLEALALGQHVVASDCPGGIREILEGISGAWLVPHSNVPALAQGIISALQFRAENTSSVDHLAGTLDKFRVGRILKQYEDLL